MIEIGIFCRRLFCNLGCQDVISWRQICRCKCPNYSIRMLYYIIRQVITANLYGLYHVRSNFFSHWNWFYYTDNFRLFTHSLIKQWCNCKADDQRQHDAKHTKYSPVFQKSHFISSNSFPYFDSFLTSVPLTAVFLFSVVVYDGRNHCKRHCNTNHDP